MQPDYDATTALIVVDVQNDFADPSGSLSVAGGDRIIPFLNAQIAAARDAGALVAYTQDWHPPSTRHFVTAGGPWPVHCVAGTWGAALHPALTQDAGPSVRKGANGEDGYSGFTMRDPSTGDVVPTELVGLLRASGTRRVVVCGLATDYCVRDTALDAIALGYPTTVLLEGVRAVDVRPGDGEAALAKLVASGADLVPHVASTDADPAMPAGSGAAEPVA